MPIQASRRWHVERNPTPGRTPSSASPAATNAALPSSARATAPGAQSLIRGEDATAATLGLANIRSRLRSSSLISQRPLRRGS